MQQTTDNNHHSLTYGGFAYCQLHILKRLLFENQKMNLCQKITVFSVR